MNIVRTGQNRSGVTLVELVVAIVVISIALAAVLSVMNFTTSHSADPMVQRQAVAVAEAYLEEVLLRDYVDPDGIGGETRATFDNVEDYNGLHDVGARNQDGQAISGLENYTVDVAVTPDNFGNPPVPALRVAVTVTDPAGQSYTLSGYRTDY